MGKKVPTIKPSTPTRPRNAFDLSQKHLFTATAGQLLPIMTIDVMPHDHIEIQATDFMRTLPMNSAAFMSMRGVYEFFFVPYSQLYHPFDQMITGMKDFNSSYFVNKDNTSQKIPSFNLTTLVDNLISKEYTYKKAVDSEGHYNAELLDDADKDMFGYPRVYQQYKLLDMLGYGKYHTKNTYTNNAITALIKRGMPVASNPFRILAYNKIYQDYYMNTTYEARDVSMFNIDKYFENENEEIPLSKLMSMLDMKYRNAQLDYFTNLRPSPLFEVPNMNHIVAFNAKTGSINTDESNVIIENNSIELNGVKSTLTVADIRFGFALEKLLDITQRAGKTYAEQIKAHFGVEVSEGRDGRVKYLGGFDSNIQVGDVTQTSGTTVTGADAMFGGYLGRVTGKAQGSGSGTIKFDAKEHGLIMCIYSIVPDMQYDAYRIDPFNRKLERGQYFMPEFEKLGMQPLNGLDITLNALADPGAIVYGWQPRYSEYKTTLDINHGQFCADEPLSYWSISRNRGKDYLGKLEIADLKISPRWLDSVFAVNYNGDEVTDQLFGGCTFNVQKVSDMDEAGIPTW